MYCFPCSFKKHTFLKWKNILEVFGIKSTELWPLMESEALTGGLIGENPFFFLSPWPYSCHTRRKHPPPSPLISLKQEYLISLNFGLWFLLSLSFFPWRRGKTLNFVQSKLNYEENSLELNKMNWAFGTESKYCHDVVDSLTMTHKHISHFDTPLIWLITLKAGWQADWIAQVS